MAPAFETPRLQVARWTDLIGDAPRRAGLAGELRFLLTPKVTAHLPPSLQAGDIDAWIDERDAESEVYVVRRRDDGALVGLLILARGDGSDPVHVGYLLAEAAWGRGYATELVQGLVAALARTGPVDLRAGVEAGNPASARVLEKAGFRRLSGGDGATGAIYGRRVPAD